MSDSASTLFASNTHAASRRSQLTKLLAARMIQGYVVLPQKCEWCDVPLMEFRGNVTCVVCMESLAQQEQEHHLDHGETQETAVRGVERSDVSTKTNATEDSIEIMLEDKLVTKGQNSSKNAVFMAAIAGLAKEARRKLVEEDERQETGHSRGGEQGNQRENTDEMSYREDLKANDGVPPRPRTPSGTLAPPALKPPTSARNDSSQGESLHETSTKEKMEPTINSEATSRINVTPLPPLSPPTNDIPEIKPSSRQLKPVSPHSAHLATKTMATSSPQLPRPSIRYPSPNLTTRKMMTINNLTKEPQDQTKAAYYREKAYTTPFRDRSKNSVNTDKSCDENSRDDNKEDKETSQEESRKEKKITSQTTPSTAYDNGFFQELKHRAALQNATHALLNAEQAAPEHSNEQRLDAVVFQPCHDEVSALGSQSSFESEIPSKACVAKRSSREKTDVPPTEAAKTLFADRPSAQQTVEVLPDDEKKDIAIECMKEFKAPLPFDEGPAKSGLVDQGAAKTSNSDDYKFVRSTPTAQSTKVAGETTSEEDADYRLMALEKDGDHSVQNQRRDENDTLSRGSTKEENQPERLETDHDGSAKSQSPGKVQIKQLNVHTSVATGKNAKIDEAKSSIEVKERCLDTAEEDTERKLQSSPTPEGTHYVAIETLSTVKGAESSLVLPKGTASGHDFAENDTGSRSVANKCPDEVVTHMNTSVKPVEVSSNDVESHTFMSGKSLRSHKSNQKDSGGTNFDEDRSLKSMPTTSYQGTIRRDFREELEEFKSKMRLAALMESKGKEEATRNISRDVTQSTVDKNKAHDKNEQQEDVGTCLISIKEIKVSSTRGDASTALASISSKMEHQTRRLAQLEAEALRKHKEAEKAAIKAREALEKMLEARSKPKEKNVASKGDKVKQADLSISSTKGSCPESLKKIPKTGGSIKAGEKEYLSLASRSKHGSRDSCSMSEKLTGTRKQADKKWDLRDGRDDRADLSMCSTLSEDSGLKFDQAATTTGGRPKDYGKDYTSVASRSGRISVAGSDVSEKLSFARSKQDEAKSVLHDRNVKQSILSEAQSLSSRPKKYTPSLRHSYSDASFSQYSNSCAESSCRSSETGSTRELESVPSNDSSTRDSSTESIQHEVSETRTKHQNTSHRTLETRRSSSKGRYRDLSPLSTRRSKSSSPVEVAKKKKSLLLPSLMSPDPPSKPGNRSHRASNDRTNRRSHSLLRNKPSRSKSKDSRKLSAKTDLLMSKTNSSKKPNHLLHYSSRHSSNVKTDTKANVPSGIMPEVRQPIMSRSTSAPQKQSDYLFSGKHPDARQPSFSSHGSAPISLANYTNRDSASSARPQIAMSPEKRFLQHEQAHHLSGTSPNTEHLMSSRHVRGHMSPPTYGHREETLYPMQATQLGSASFHQYLPGQSLTPKSINEHGHFGFKSGSFGSYPMSRNVDSIALAPHTTLGERMSQARAHHHPAMNFSETTGMHAPLMMSSGTVRPPYSSGQADYLREEGLHYIKPHDHKAEGMHTPLTMSNGTVRPPYSSGHAEYLHDEGMHYVKPQEHKVRFVDPYIGGSENGVDMNHANQHYSMPYGRHTGY
eukprot:CCRYP_012232-RA/>CCRYP_012232-RA protein AED:0.32 eAED:0.32 QI:0/-1/0/1/-1/1/1/0/1579